MQRDKRTEVPKFSDPTGEHMSTISMEQLRKQQDSLMENICVLRFSIAKVEYLQGMLKLALDLLSDCRIIIEAHGHKALVKQIDRLIQETAQDVAEAANG